MPYILFIKPVPFMFIKKGDMFEVKTDFDNQEYIEIRRKRIYLRSREHLGYFKYISQEGIEKELKP